MLPWLPLFVALGVINAAVALALNPWRDDRLPDRFPHIVQDALVVALFALVATLVLRERMLATTAVGAVVVGLALQDTLGNLFAGLAIQIEKPFRVGHWVHVGTHQGTVYQITWRATKIRTTAGNVVVVPNSVVARDTIVNYSEPTADTRLEVDVGVSYDAPPNHVKAVIIEALRGEPLICRDKPPEIVVTNFADSSITYRVEVWTPDYAAHDRLPDRVRTRIYYAFRRHGISIPYPMRVHVPAPAVAPPDDRAAQAAALATVEIFAPLDDAEREALLERTRPVAYAAGETIVCEGDRGSSMFVVVRGEASVVLDGREVARPAEGGFFGEMSLLTGDPRTATVVAVTDCDLLKITSSAFRDLVLAAPAVLDRVTEAVAARREGLERHRAEGLATAAPDVRRSFASRVRRFLKLSVT